MPSSLQLIIIVVVYNSFDKLLRLLFYSVQHYYT